MRKPAAQAFNEIAAEAYQAFPDELENLVVCATSSKMPVFIAPAVAEKLRDDIEGVKKAVQERTATMLRTRSGGLAKRNYPLAGTKVSMISVLQLRRDAAGAFFSLDHELAHFILKNGSVTAGVPAQKAESAADAFAMLRHIQRFGLYTRTVRLHAQETASSLLLENDAGHYTSKALQKAVSLAREKDISGLSLHDTAKLAEEIADACALEEKTLGRISKAFGRARMRLSDEMGGRAAVANKWILADKKARPFFCRETLAVMQKHWRDPDIFEAGRMLLRHPALMNFMRDAAQTDPYWKNALKFIDNPEALVRRKFLRRAPCL